MPVLARVTLVPTCAFQTYGAWPVGAGIGAVVGRLPSAPACLGVAAALFLVQAALILLSLAVRVRRQPQTAGEIPGPHAANGSALRLADVHSSST